MVLILQEMRYLYELLQIDKENDTIFYKYDNQGNTLEQTSSKGTTTYQYDIYNRTRQVTTENGDIIKNKYDPLGFRYRKEVNGETHNYIFDGWSITAETNKYGELKSREVRGYGLVKKETNNKQYYYHQNEHGDITHLTNTDSEVENCYRYDVFGNIREQQENVENVFKYAGEQQDQETEQYYLRARFYNPVIARFTQEDVYRGDGLNLYIYVVNNPLLWFDPSGYAKCSSDELTPEEYQRNKEELKKMYQDFVEKKHESVEHGVNRNLIKYRVDNEDPTKVIVIKELEFDTYGNLQKKAKKGDGVTGHHMPSADYMMKKFGVSKDDSYAMNLEQKTPGSGGRHRRTFSYGRMPDEVKKRYFKLNARDMLAFDLWDARRVLKEDGLWNSEARKVFSDYIKAYEEAYPEIFKKKGK